MDLTDTQTKRDEKFQFIMVPQDLLTQFVLLCASKYAGEVVYHLNDIFLEIGAPCILLS